MQRTASLTTTAGGYAVPVELDTSLLLTNAGVVNPIRQLARVRQTNVNTVEFINTTGITAAYGATRRRRLPTTLRCSRSRP
jgi:HK97 family phage major capsid protein